MQDWDDMTLLRAYLEQDSEGAFATLVARHVNKVYSVAWRHTGNSHQAEEITQAVFVILARKCRRLGKGVILSGWLYQTARLTAMTFIRGEIRRARREEEVQMQVGTDENETEMWQRIAPWLDLGMAGLSEADRQAVILRFFDGKTMREVAAALGAREDAAKQRVNRAVEKLRRFFLKRGISLSAAGLAAALAANSVRAAPAGLAGAVSALALAKGAAESGANLALAKGVLKIMAWTKMQMAVVGAAVVGLAAFSAMQYQAQGKLREQNEALRQRVDALSPLAMENERLSNLLAQANNSEALAKSQLNALRARGPKSGVGKVDTTAGPVSAPAAAVPATVSELPKGLWANAGFATPQAALKTRGWAVMNGDRALFGQSVYITPGARKMIEDMLVQMASASTAPDKERYVRDAMNNKFGAEEAILMPMTAENQAKTYTGYRILSQEAPVEDQMVLQVETDMASAPAKTETLKFQHFGDDWKVVVDEEVLRQEMAK